MRRKRPLILGLALSLMLVGCGNVNTNYLTQTRLLENDEPVVAAEVEFNAGTDKGTQTGGADDSVNKNGVYLTTEASPLGNNDNYRIYKGKSLTVSLASGSTKVVTEVEFTCTASNTTKYGPGCFAAQDGYSYSGTKGTWSGSASSVTFVADSNQVRATKIVVRTGSGSSTNKCTVTFNTTGDAIDPIDVEKDGYLAASKIPTAVKANDTNNQIRYEFAGWYTTSTFTTGTEFDENYQVKQDITVYAKFNPIHYYLIHFHMGEGGTREDMIVDDNNQPVGDVDGTTGGFNFLGWYTTPNCSDGTEFDPNTVLNSNIDLYAKLERIAVLEDYRLNMVPYNKGWYRIVGEVTAITDDDKFFVQDGENVMYISDSKFTSNLHIGNTVDLAGKYHYSGAIVEFTDIAYCDIVSSDTVISQTPIEKVADCYYNNNLKYIELDGLKLTSGFEAVGTSGALRANFENQFGNNIYISNTSYVNNGSFNKDDYAAGDYVFVKGGLYRYYDTMEYCITSIEKRTPLNVTLVYDAEDPTQTVETLAMVGGKVQRPDNPGEIKDENYYYTLENWYLNLSDTEPFDFSTPVYEDVTLYAKYTKTVRPANEVVLQDLKARSFLSYKYETESVDTTVSHELVNSNTVKQTNTTYKTWTYADAATGIGYAGQSAGDKGSGTEGTIQLRTTNSNSGIVVTTNTKETSATKITVVWSTASKTNSSDLLNTAGRSLKVYGKDTAYTDPSDLYNETNQGTLLTNEDNPELVFNAESPTTVLNITGDYKYIGIRSAGNAVYLASITIEWGNGTTTQYTYSDVYLRYSGFISVSLWDRLEAESDIQGYGILLCETEWLGSGWLHLKEVDGTNVKRFYTAVTDSHPHPTLANDRQKGDLTGDYYIWNLKKAITNENLTKSYTAVPFIVIDGETLYIQQVDCSAKSKAAEYISTGFYPSDYDEGALYNLANLTVEAA